MQASLVSGKADLLAGRANDALPLLARALELGREHYDPDRSLRYAAAQIAMAECMLDLGRSAESRELFAKAAANHATHTELAERYREPLRHLRARITVFPRRPPRERDSRAPAPDRTAERRLSESSGSPSRRSPLHLRTS